VETPDSSSSSDVLVVVPNKQSQTSDNLSSVTPASTQEELLVLSEASSGDEKKPEDNKEIKSTPSVAKTKATVVKPSKTTKVYTSKAVAKANTSKLPVSKSGKTPVVKINKTKSLLADAYDAYRVGNYGKAAVHFQNALNSDSKNIHAYLGLGAIDVINKNYSSAVRSYEKVLSLEPNNLNALEAIANLSGLVPLNEEWERQLFTMAEIYPKSAVLQNACGNSFARKNDWLAAQQNYFNAHANMPQNPDYMVNLAVSYDHIGEYKLASQYYTQAMAYVGKTKVSFDTNQVKARLVSIRQLAMKGR